MIRNETSKSEQPSPTDQQGTKESAAFKTLYEEYFERLFYFAKKYVKADEAARDVVSEVFLNLWKNKSKNLEIKDIRAYLYACTKNESLRVLRSQVGQKIPLDGSDNHQVLLDFAIENFTPEDAILHQELQGVIEATIEALPHQCKMVYKLVKEDGLKHEEVAKIMGISPNTVKNHVIKALKRSRMALENYLAEEKRHSHREAKVIYMQMVAPLLLLVNFF